MRCTNEPRAALDRLSKQVPVFFIMREDACELAEATELLNLVESWSDQEVKELPELYQEKAREFRRLANSGEK